MIKKLIFMSLCLSALAASGQTSSFTLKQCIEYAWLNNLDIRQSILNNESANVDFRQSKTNLLPSLSLSAGQNYQFGRTVDRFTNTFINQTIRSNNIGLSAGLTIFNGFQNQHYIKSQRALEKSSVEDVETVKNTVALNISSAFLQAIQADEMVKNANTQMESTKLRIERAQRMVDAGATDLSALLSLKAQLANEQLNLVTAANNKNSAMLNLKTYMQMPPENELEIVLPEIPIDLISNPFSATELYEIAIHNMPQIKAAQYRYEASLMQSRMSKGSLSPTISLYGSVSTVYSQSAKALVGYQLTGVQVIGITRNTNDSVLQPTFAGQFQTIGFARQLRDNIGQSAGINLSWNLFNGFQVQNQIQKAKINSYISEMNLLRAQNTLLNEVNAAVNSYNAAKARYDASRDNVQAQQLSLDYIQRRFDAGASTSLDFIQSKNNLLQAQSNETQAKYELVFRGLILEFYKGNPIKL
jgi:outer membrane protein